jgi:RNA polymerase sigma factor (sigma-70 family)
VRFSDRSACLLEEVQPELLKWVRRRFPRELSWALSTEDVVQETLLRAHRCSELLGKLETKQQWTWLTTAARRFIWRTAERSRLERRAKRSSAGSDSLRIADLAEPALERRTRLRAAIQRLPIRQRTVTEQFYLQGRSIAAISVILGTSRTAVRKSLHQARNNLRKLLNAPQAARPSRSSSPSHFFWR